MLNLTRQEKVVIQFLVACFLVGATIHLYKTRISRVRYEKSLQQSAEADTFRNQAGQVDSEYTEIQQRADQSAISKSKVTLQHKINLNTATKQDLMLLPKIGPVTAENILAYRTQVGKFSNIEELLKIKGIGNKTFERIKGDVTLE